MKNQESSTAARPENYLCMIILRLTRRWHWSTKLNYGCFSKSLVLHKKIENKLRWREDIRWLEWNTEHTRGSKDRSVSEKTSIKWTTQVNKSDNESDRILWDPIIRRKSYRNPGDDSRDGSVVLDPIGSHSKIR
jgi:hypothetical protein